MDTTSKKYDCDYLYEDLSSLVNDSFKSWYIKCFYQLGKERVLQLASVAKADGEKPQKLFAYLLKKEMRG